MSALDRPCPKCESRLGHEVRYERLNLPWASGLAEPRLPVERLCLTCRRCGYQQVVPTRDATGEDAE